MNTKEALTKLVKAGRTALATDTGLRNLGYDTTPYFDIYGSITDAVYAMLGEHTESFSESVTCKAFESPDFSDDQRVSFLLREFENSIRRITA